MLLQAILLTQATLSYVCDLHPHADLRHDLLTSKDDLSGWAKRLRLGHAIQL